MLENSDKLKSLDRDDLVRVMLRDLSWSALKDVIQANNTLLKRCTLGGHRLEPKRRERFEKVIAKEAEKEDYSSEFCTPLFAQWYPLQGDLHAKLEEYFHSDEYKTYCEENDVDEDAYVLPQEKFEEFFEPEDVQKWRVLVAFSPLEFSDEQADAVLDTSAGSPELLQELERVQAEREEQTKELNRLKNENDDLRERSDEASKEAQALRRERKNLRSEVAALQAKFEASQNENKRLREELSAREQEVGQVKEQASSDFQRKATKLSSELERRHSEVGEWQSKYEAQRAETRKLSEKLHEAEKALAEERIARDKMRKELQRSRSFADLFLSKIDWAAVGRQLKMTPQLKLRFNSLIRTLHYDEDNIPRLSESMSDFWTKLQAQERALVEKIAQSDTQEVESGDVDEYWQSLTDVFEDVHIGLEARTILLQMLHEIFYQDIDTKQLKDDRVPVSPVKTRK